MPKKDIPEIKMILLGESGVGKTSIIKRYLKDEFDSNEESTLSMSYVAKSLEIDKKKIRVNIWDTIGQEKYRSISKLFLNETKIVILVYSIISEQSFKELDYWYKLYKEVLDEDTILGIAGNKMDLYLEQTVPDSKAREYAEQKKAIFSLLSAKDNKQSIDLFIEKLVNAYLNKKSSKKDNNKVDENNTIKLDEKKNENNENESGSDGCCLGGSSKKKKKKKKYEAIIKENDGIINSIFLGENGVGKTSIIKRIRGIKFNKDEKHTEEIKDYSIEYKNLRLKCYDIDNEKKKTKEALDIITSCKIFFIVYNIKDKISFDNVGYWIETIRKYKEEELNKGNNHLLVIIGNKNDKSPTDKEECIIINEGDKKEYIEEGEELANENKGMFKVVSALDNKGFENMIEEVIEGYLNL